jgi:hypothetical protein
MLNICIGDGLAPTKIDGWIHACTLTAKAIVKYAADPDAGLDIVGITSWTGGNSALRYARWQADFHWKIDTRPWQFFLYMFPMKWAFRDNIKADTSLSDEDRQALLEVNESFWEEVVCAYAYRSEVIERARGFAPHPDPTCGSSWQGYPYRRIWERDDVPFSRLALPFIETAGGRASMRWRASSSLSPGGSRPRFKLRCLAGTMTSAITRFASRYAMPSSTGA